MKIIVTHASPDWDAITSVWLIRRFLPGWNESAVQFVPAGERLKNSVLDDPIERIGRDELIHVDTGLGPLDHHQTDDQEVCAASRTWEYVENQISNVNPPTGGQMSNDKWNIKKQSITRIVKVVVDIDHFKEVFWDNPTADYYEFSLLGVLEGLKLQKPNEDDYYIEIGLMLLDSVLHNFENRIWAEKEIDQDGLKFETKWGKGLGFLTINDTVLKLAQKMGYIIIVRKDPRKGYVRIKARPSFYTSSERSESRSNSSRQARTVVSNVDLTLVYEKLKKIDPKATWFLHVSKKMLLNGTPKNPKMVPTKLSLQEIISVLESI